MAHDVHFKVTDEVRRARLRWRAKRGLLENDIFMTRFFNAYEYTLTDEQVYGLDLLLDLPDNDLYELIMGRKNLVDVDPAEHVMTSEEMQLAEQVLILLKSV
ncbi:succinate dehydrogenase assembly factor 2 [Hydromonas duriensis]|uniref:FAD assembly factor SdhE n=1 Tax=Hydromonas duriensis TaxID=1527608 RepID=A0A4R6Y1R9_9BURK|nr:succinate dehydrogenase assembly factor 2 [Hydromonas duriensis]TDR30388.1 succinate dehydrogenase flavin-adding protein (antitoxin of CptAB toxin-antitoxin module) [Hydromonas duriensis]